jgi:hypothetical protein
MSHCKPPKKDHDHCKPRRKKHHHKHDDCHGRKKPKPHCGHGGHPGGHGGGPSHGGHGPGKL